MEKLGTSHIRLDELTVIIYDPNQFMTVGIFSMDLRERTNYGTPSITIIGGVKSF